MERLIKIKLMDNSMIEVKPAPGAAFCELSGDFDIT